jgi:hypothetical protein
MIQRLIVYFAALLLPTLAFANTEPLYVTRVTALRGDVTVYSTVLLQRANSVTHQINSRGRYGSREGDEILHDYTSLIISAGPQAERDYTVDTLFTVENANGSGPVATAHGPELVQYGQGYRPAITQAQLDKLLRSAAHVAIGCFDFYIYVPQADRVEVAMYKGTYREAEDRTDDHVPFLQFSQPISTPFFGYLDGAGNSVTMFWDPPLP